MPVFKLFFKIVRTNKGSILVYGAVFFIIALLLTNSAEENDKAMFQSTNLKIAIIDRDDSELSKGFRNAMESFHTLVEIKDNKEAMQDELYYRTVEYIMIIPEGFGKVLESGEIPQIETMNVPGSSSSYFINVQIEQYFRLLSGYMATGGSITEAIQSAKENFQNGAKIVESNMLTDTNNTKKAAYYFQYLAYILPAIAILGISPVLILWNKKDVHQRNNISTMMLTKQNMQLGLGCVVFTLCIWLFFVIVSICFFGDILLKTSLKYTIINSFVYTFVCLSIAFMIGFLAKTVNIMEAICNTLTLGMAFICGVFVPQAVLGEGVLKAARFLPAYWYVKLNDIFIVNSKLAGENLKTFWTGILVQICFAIAFFSVALVASKKNQRN